MTAEALATRLLLNEKVDPAAIKEAEEYILRQPPGIGRDKYYGCTTPRWRYTNCKMMHGKHGTKP